LDAGPLCDIAIGTQTVGTPFGITITAEDAYNNTFTGFADTVNLSTTAGSISPSVTAAFTNGIWSGSATVSGAGLSTTITATNGVSGTSNAFDVNKASQTISVSQSAPASAAYNSTFGVAATSDSGLGVAITRQGRAQEADRICYHHNDERNGTCTVNYNQQVMPTTTRHPGDRDDDCNACWPATLTIVAPASLAYGSTATLSTTGGSGTGAVTYSAVLRPLLSSRQHTFSDRCQRHMLVTATKAADANYSVATSSAATVTLQKADQTISFECLAARHG